MDRENHKVIKAILKDMIAKHGIDDTQLDALLDYVFTQTNNNEQNPVDRLSYILGQNLAGGMEVRSVVQLEIQQHKIDSLQRQVGELNGARSPQNIQWLVVQGIFTAISFIASIVSLLSAFGIIDLSRFR